MNQLLPPSEHDAFLQALHALGTRCIRMHVDHVDAALPFAVSPVPWFSAGRLLDDSNIRPASFLNFAIGDYYIQDAASLLPLALLDVQPEDVVCDLCAAPGGKASAIAERLGPDGFLLANESIHSRLDVLKYALARSGNPTYGVSSCDPDVLATHAARMFDAVLVDAPCSGQTLVGKNKRDDNAFADNQIEHCAMRQRRILLAAIRLLKTGGRLIYSTCTFAVEENESQVRWLQEKFPNAWEPIEPAALDPWKSTDERGCYRLWPHRDPCGGGFAAGLRLVKELDFEPCSDKRILKDTSKPTRNKRMPLVSRKENQKAEEAKQAKGNQILEELGRFEDMDIEWRSGYAHGLTRGVANAIQPLSHLGVQPPTFLIETGHHFVPTQALAMLNDRFFTANQRVELSHGQSIEFISGSSIAKSADQAAHPTGWSIASWHNRSLGWLKSAGNRWNNHLPAWARIIVTR